MKRWPILILFALAACSGNSEGPPRNFYDACAMRAERPEWFDAMERTEARWGVPVEVQLATLYQESGFRPRARTPRTYAFGFIPTGRVSSAYGYAQAIDGTWEWYRDETGRRFARRHDFHDATDFMGWYMSKATETLGIPPDDAYNHYLAYHEGHAGFGRQSYWAKRWLMETAARVDRRAAMYRGQLDACP